MYDFLHKALKLPYELHSTKHGDWSDASRPVIVLIHGIGANLRIWDEVIAGLEPAPMIAVDLLGFGQSRKPDWSQYSLTDHAKALEKTLRRRAHGRQLVLCGHSLGTLVAIEYAKLFPRNVASLVLCAPPIYRAHDIKKRPLREAIVKAAGKRLLDALESQPSIIKTMNYYRGTQPHFFISPEGAKSFVQTAKNSIWLQTSFHDIIHTIPNVPLAIIYGTLDAVMIPGNFKIIKKQRTSPVAIHSVIAGHEIRARFTRVIVKALQAYS